MYFYESRFYASSLFISFTSVIGQSPDIVSYSLTQIVFSGEVASEQGAVPSGHLPSKFGL